MPLKSLQAVFNVHSSRCTSILFERFLNRSKRAHRHQFVGDNITATQQTTRDRSAPDYQAPVNRDRAASTSIHQYSLVANK